MCVPIIDPECVRTFCTNVLFMYPCCTMVDCAKSPNLNHVDFEKFIDEPITTNNLSTTPGMGHPHHPQTTHSQHGTPSPSTAHTPSTGHPHHPQPTHQHGTPSPSTAHTPSTGHPHHPQPTHLAWDTSPSTDHTHSMVTGADHSMATHRPPSGS